ncbi:MAG: ATPase domain-containing protein [Candidatus Thorarchaeota archaeon]
MNIIAGSPGKGKSILAWHFLFDGVSSSEIGLLVSLDQTSDMTVEDMTDFEWDHKKAMDSGVLTILS